MKYFVLIFLLFPFLLFSQEKGTFMIEAQADYRMHRFSELNELINDEYYAGSVSYDKVLMEGGMSYGLNVLYVVTPFINIGLYGEFQNSSTTQKKYYEYGVDPTVNFQDVILNTYRVQSYNLGISTNFNLNNVSFWKNTSWLSRIDSKINLQIGYGKAFFISKSKTISSEYLESINLDVDNAGSELLAVIYSSDGFQAIASLKLGYQLSKSRYFTSVGINVGYQYFTTNAINYKRGDEKIFPHPELRTKLDLSGLTAGIYLTIGR